MRYIKILKDDVILVTLEYKHINLKKGDILKYEGDNLYFKLKKLNSCEFYNRLFEKNIFYDSLHENKSECYEDCSEQEYREYIRNLKINNLLDEKIY